MARRPRDHSQAIRIIGLSSQRAFNPRWPQAVFRCSAKAPVHGHCLHTTPKTALEQEQYLVNTNRSICIGSASENRSTTTSNPSCVATLDTPVSIFLSSLCLGIGCDFICANTSSSASWKPPPSDRTSMWTYSAAYRILVLRSSRLDKPDYEYVWEGDQSTATFECIRGASRVSKYSVDHWQ